MKNAYGDYLIIIIVLTFLILFTGYICLSINQAKAFNIKNEVVKAVEIYGYDNSKRTQLAEYIKNTLREEGYNIRGRCPENSDAYDVDGEPATNKNNAAFCIEKKAASNGILTSGYYCKVTTFYNLNIPFVSSVINNVATGETKTLYK